MAQDDFPMDDIVADEQVVDPAFRVGTPPIPIASPQAPRMSRNPSQTADPPLGKLNLEQVHRNAAKKKKKKRGAMKPAAPATTTVRGFQTPGASGGEESDISAMSTPRLGPSTAWSSVASSPSLRPSAGPGGISALKLQLENLNLGSSRTAPGHSLQRVESHTSHPESMTISSNDSVASTGSDSDRTEIERYEISLDQDFISPDVDHAPHSLNTVLGAQMESSRYPTMARKMSADDFEPLHCLGQGTYGTVLLVRQRESGRLYAQKQFRKASLVIHKRLVEHTKTERAILESVNRHPFIVKLFYAFQDHEKLYLILEYAQGGELFYHLKQERMLPEDTVAFYMAEMVLALDHLHRNIGVVYRDLKPENILLDSEGHVLLTDFGLSKVSVDGNECKSMLGTLEYMAPEVIQEVSYGFAVDWWSLGALGFDLLTGSSPFYANNMTKIQEKILKAQPKFPYYCSEDARTFFTRLLRKNPKQRLGGNMPKDMQVIKSHRFFRKIDWKKLERKELDPPIRPIITDPALAENFSEEFTGMNLDPMLAKDGFVDGGNNPFGGFSFVASESLLECGYLPA